MRRRNIYVLIVALSLINIFYNSKVVQAINNEINQSIIVIDKKLQQEEELSIMFTGDILMHDSMMESVKENGEYKFDDLFKEIKGEFEGNDINISNIESGINEERPVSGYPCFNAPKGILDTMKNLKVKVLINSHNHILDTGYQGLTNTLKKLEESGIKTLGAGYPENKKSIVLNKGKIKAGVMAYTYGVNGGNKYKDYINYIDKENIKKEIKHLKGVGCNYLIVYLHIGTEYKLEIETYQKELIDFIINQGVDAVVCSHPHVPRKSEIIKIDNKAVYVNYGMGNFISNQNYKYTDIGTISKIKIGYSEGKTFLKSASSIPVYRLRYEEEKKIYRAILVRDLDKFKEHIYTEDIKIIKKVANDVGFKYTCDKTKSSLKILKNIAPCWEYTEV
ncbi:CapA family protein [Oceanirhabdus sp. W0125-5]|uniref:CapA family protein n=1 Tax=Oceanirhabdus sp. W0125-5 TaxID=2999116 RepID=UPI0022F33A16|nr:CapA family protein [Oceanirhabdus sp. W0125-5]WBW96830.1 CapA family protein [Oceanirhabdus sp. W0125-5]